MLRYPDAPNKKRKAPEQDQDSQSRDIALGVLAPSQPNGRRSVSTTSRPNGDGNDFDVDEDGAGATDPDIYNGFLEKVEGWFAPKKLQQNSAAWANLESVHPGKYAHVDASTLPTPAMIKKAATVNFSEEVSQAFRLAFLRKAKAVPKVYLENNLDNTTPSLDFTFIRDFVLRDGVVRPDPGTFEGCRAPCRPNMGQSIGCEYTRDCICLEYAAVDEAALQKLNVDVYERYMLQKQRGDFIDTSGLPKRFPYSKPAGGVPARLQHFYREQRHPVYECNPNCNCGPRCKSRLVQKGRKVPLTIFRTENRGWGVYCNEDLVQGEFIDTYLGEVITNQEADRREAVEGKDKNSYLYSLDKFIGDQQDLTEDSCYVVDGEHMGGPTRFINHSCEPNVRQYTVSYNKHDLRVYDLAFFAVEDIPAGTELNFDYMDNDEEEEEVVIQLREAALRDPANAGKTPCNCGARKCRGFLWT